MRNKKILLIIIPILLLLVLGAAFVALYLTTDMFKSNNILFAKYFMQNQEMLSIIENENLENQTNLKDTSTYTSNGNLEMSVDNGISTKIVNATTATRYDANTQRTYSEICLKKGQEDLLKLSFINSGDVYSIKCDDILGNYIGFRNSNLKAFAKNMGMSDEEIKIIPNEIDFNSLNNFLKISEEQKQHLINNYSSIITNNISKDKFTKVEKSNIAVDNINYEATGYTLSLDTHTVRKIMIDFLNRLKADNTTLTFISNKLSLLGLEGQYIDITNLSNSINELIVELQEAKFENKEEIRLIVYVNNGKTLRNEILFFDEGSEIEKILIDINNTDKTNKINVTIYDILADGLEYDSINEANIQITIEKTVTDSGIINKTMIVPDTTNMSQYILTETNIGKIQNNEGTNTSKIVISSSTDGTTTETVTSSYVQNIKFVSEIEEIMELKNSNSIIINNYSIEQLTPFFTNISNKVAQVMPNKIAQLAIVFGEDISNENLTSSDMMTMNNGVVPIAQMIGAAGGCIINVNGNLQEIGANIGFSLIPLSITIISQNTIIDKAMDAIESVELDKTIEELKQEVKDEVQVKLLAEKHIGEITVQEHLNKEYGAENVIENGDQYILKYKGYEFIIGNDFTIKE